MSNDKIIRLEKYAQGLKDRLRAAVPEKHAHRPEVFKKMLETDLARTLADIKKLTGSPA
jgi:hypothetical protein